ncbi:MAG: IMP dehydrogenase [Candidatus Andersenbacteria bacterium]
MPSNREAFFRHAADNFLGLSFDDVLLIPRYSEVEPDKTSVAGKFSRGTSLGACIVSSPMDTVTGSTMGIAMADNGGLGIIHRSMTIEQQVAQVVRVGTYRNAKVHHPRCVRTTDTLAQVEAMRERDKLPFHSFPVLDEHGRVVGLLTGSNFELCDTPTQTLVGAIMHREPLSASPDTTMDDAFVKMQQSQKTLLLLLDEDRRLAGMYVSSDVLRIRSGSQSPVNTNNRGQLRVGAAVGVRGDTVERAQALHAAGVDVVVVDSAHGDSAGVHETVRAIKKSCTGLELVAGNISTRDAANHLIGLGVDGLRVGQGPGSICTTRVVTGCGRAQLAAIADCASVALPVGVPVCADGGIRESGDVVKALAAGASSVMLGNLLAGTDESPGQVVRGPAGKDVKHYRGMGSAEAMAESESSRNRYSGKSVPEGVAGSVRYAGPVSRRLLELLGGIRSGLGYNGAASIAELHEVAHFERLTTNGLRESHPHDIIAREEGQ